MGPHKFSGREIIVRHNKILLTHPECRVDELWAKMAPTKFLIFSKTDRTEYEEDPIRLLLFIYSYWWCLRTTFSDCEVERCYYRMIPRSSVVGYGSFLIVWYCGGKFWWCNFLQLGIMTTRVVYVCYSTVVTCSKRKIGLLTSWRFKEVHIVPEKRHHRNWSWCSLLVLLTATDCVIIVIAFDWVWGSDRRRIYINYYKCLYAGFWYSSEYGFCTHLSTGLGLGFCVESYKT